MLPPHLVTPSPCHLVALSLSRSSPCPSSSLCFRFSGGESGAAPRPPAALTLVAAAYDAVSHVVDLTFDRPVSVAGADPNQFLVDEDTGDRYRGSGAPTLLAPAVVRVTLAPSGPVIVPQTVLIAGPDTHLAAVDDGGTWAGVTNLPLPFGS